MTYCSILILNSSDVNKRKMTIVASTVSLTLFVILGFATFGFWRNRVKHHGNIIDAIEQSLIVYLLIWLSTKLLFYLCYELTIYREIQQIYTKLTEFSMFSLVHWFWLVLNTLNMLIWH